MKDELKTVSTNDEPCEDQLLARVDDIIKEFSGNKGNLIPILQKTQTLFGYLPESALKKISVALHKPYSEVAGVVGFYSFFSTVPKGKYLVNVCLGTACYVRGGQEVMKALSDELGIKLGETTSDRMFTLSAGRCFGACGLAPVIMINDDVHQRVKPSKVAEILKAYK